MSQQLGMSRKSFQEWDYILGQNGVSMDSMNTAMKSMTGAMASLADEGAKGQETLGKLGVTIDDLKNMKQEEIFEKAVIALQNMDEGYEKARLSQMLFGKQGQEMLPMLNQSKGSIEELKQKAHDLGLVLNDETIDAGVVFGDTLDNMKRSMGAMVTQIGAEVMPIFQKMLDWVLEHMPIIKEIASNVFEAIGNTIQWLSDNANWLIPILAGVLAGFVALKMISVVTTLIGAFNAIMAAAAAAGGLFNLVMLANPMTWVVLGIVALIAAITALVMNFDKVKAAATSLWNVVKDVFGKMRDWVTSVFDTIAKAIKLPKLEITGKFSILPPSVPKFNVKWNAEGGIFSKPTIFDTSAGFQGVGEAGPEAIAPISKLQDMLDWNKNEIDEVKLAKAIKKELDGFAVVLNGQRVGEFVDTRIYKGLKGAI